MLIRQVAKEFGENVRVVSEDFGASELARRFGVQRYPAVFVNDVLVAKPKDFGFFGEGGSQGSGRYTPWLEPESHARFAADLRRFVRSASSGELAAAPAESTVETRLERLPDLELVDLFGQTWESDALRESVTIVEFWATWCPPCLRTLPWLSTLQERYPDQIQVLGVAVESPKEDIIELIERLGLVFPVVVGTPELAQAFGDLTAVPTMFLFDRGGARIRTFYGAPPDLHGELEGLLEGLLPDREGR